MKFTGTSGRVYDYKDWFSTFQAYNAFLDGGRLYYYDKVEREWRNVRQPTVSYTPKPGDYLIRQKNSALNIDEHSMMILKWINVRKVAKVINGPWPVTIRTLDIHYLSKYKGHEYFIGQI